MDLQWPSTDSTHRIPTSMDSHGQVALTLYFTSLQAQFTTCVTSGCSSNLGYGAMVPKRLHGSMLMWIKQCHIFTTHFPGNANHTTYIFIYGCDWGMVDLHLHVAPLVPCGWSMPPFRRGTTLPMLRDRGWPSYHQHKAIPVPKKMLVLKKKRAYWKFKSKWTESQEWNWTLPKPKNAVQDSSRSNSWDS